MDWNAIINWPGITMCVSVIAAAWYFIEREIQHKKASRFDIALSKIYNQIERFVAAANKVRVNINTMPLTNLLEQKSCEIDEWITHPIYELENMALLSEMFFAQKDRYYFEEMVSAAIDFKYELHKASASVDDSSKLSIYDSARVAFNKKYSSAMNGLIEIINKRLLGQWEYDLTGVRVPKFLYRREKHKKHQQ